MNKKSESKIVVSVEDFAKMTSDEIAKLVRANLNYWIVGDLVGKDRHIVEINKIDYV